MDGNHESHDRAMIILKAPSPGGPVEGLGVPEEEEESRQVVPGPSVDLSRPSSSSPAPAPKGPESWRNWKKEIPPDLSRRSARNKDLLSKGCWKGSP